MNRLISSFLLIFGLIFSVCSQEWKPAKVAVMTTWGEKIDPAHVLKNTLVRRCSGTIGLI